MNPDVLVLNNKIESRNVLDRQHWAVKRKSKGIWALFVRNQMKLCKVEKSKEGERFKLTIISYRKRLLDKDNLYGGIKGLLDACIDEELIYDDSPKYLDLEVDQYTCKKEETIIIRKPL
tara:strand:+ start:6351 stop:6707 length:357 start_codon:yes stop_codon:yes gene_type:complete